MRDIQVYIHLPSYIRELRLRNTCGVTYNSHAKVYPDIQTIKLVYTTATTSYPATARPG